jgi:WD domain, G-beta repeat/Planctomycete cytochrome C
MMRSLILAILFAIPSSVLADDAPGPDYASQVAPILTKYCAGCHNDEDREGDFSLESYASLREGSPHGTVFKAGDSAASRMIRQVTGAAKPFMPPKGEPRPGESEIATLKAWIDSGGRGPKGEPADRMTLNVPKIASRASVRPITALDASRDGKWLAVARYESVEIKQASAEGDKPVLLLEDFPGKVTSVHFVADGTRLVTASGVVGLGGEAAIWNVPDGSLIRRFPGHRDLLFDAELSPDGKTLATSGYDRTIRLWSAENGKLLRELTGHNGAVYDVAFSPDGRFLVSASADDTCKVWRVEDGTRMDTLTQPLKEEYACAFSPDGKTIVAGGADNTIRVWDFVSRDRPGINPPIVARFAHEGPIVRLAFTPDGSRLISTAEDRTIKVWETADYAELKLWEREPDVASAMAVSGDGNSFRVGRMDGSSSSYAIPTLRERNARETPAEKPPTSVSEVDQKDPKRIAEREPNDAVSQANDLDVPAAITGTIAGRVNGVADSDLFRFDAKAGESWVIEVNAARAGSKLDSFVEVLDSKGGRIERVRFQAVRDSYFTFRGKDDSQAADFRLFQQDEMFLNDYLYANGEVVKLWLYPRGPDSGFLVYPGSGKRWGYFDTTPLTHALGEPCYIVQPHPPGTELIPNGLPVFSLYYDNDDEARRELGKDSKLFFNAPHDGRYLVKIRDIRGLEGAGFSYTMTVRPGRPDFQVDLKEPKPTIGAGTSQEFKVTARRSDGFEGPIRVEIDGLPPGFTASSPLVIEAGQVEALGVIAAKADASSPTPDQLKAVKVTASATILGQEISHPVKSLGPIKLAEKPTLKLQILPAEGGARPVGDRPDGPLEFEIHPGQTIELKVRVERNGHVGQVPLGNEGAGRNLPFGVIVDNIGLNGLLITEKQDERTFFLTADKSVPPQTRQFHLSTTAGGGHSSPPVILHVR